MYFTGVVLVFAGSNNCIIYTCDGLQHYVDDNAQDLESLTLYPNGIKSFRHVRLNCETNGKTKRHH